MAGAGSSGSKTASPASPPLFFPFGALAGDGIASESFKGVGICSHVLAINHIVQKFNVRYELKSIQTAASKKAAAKVGNPKPLPALKRAHVPEPDSSDEEAERLLALGREGK